MLQKLHIRNYAIIDHLSIDFHQGFNIITGETGAGKSILMGALGLVLGDRADTSVLFHGEEKCVVEACFVPANLKALHAMLAAHDLDTDNQLLLRREISAQGKSRSFINDTPVTLQVLKVFGTQMADLHRQFDTLELGSDDFQRNVLDALAGNQTLVKEFGALHNGYTKLVAELNKLQQSQAGANRELDYFQFLFTELEDAKLEANEIETLEEELQLLSNAESIKQSVAEATMVLSNGETPVVQSLKAAIQRLQAIRISPPGLADLIGRLQSVHIELKDIAQELEALHDNIHMDADRLNQVSERLNLANRLLKKHGVTTTAELLSIQADLDQRLQSVLNLDEQISALQLQISDKKKSLLALGEQLSAQRRKVVKPLEEKVKALLTQVGMPNAVLKVDMQKAAEPLSHGLDLVSFLFDANKSGRFEPLEKVASGGELSRLMLSVKSLVARTMQLPTLIFDEIDTGISGEAARQVGTIMQSLAESLQMIAITHQPQIAARAQAHYFVYKQEKAGRVHTSIRRLADNERVEAIAKMLSGEKLTEASVQIAREMVGVL